MGSPSSRRRRVSSHQRRVQQLLRAIYPNWSPGRRTTEICLGELIRGLAIPADLAAACAREGVNINQLRIDLWVPGQIAIEVHGEQHARPVQFANSILDPEAELRRRQELDRIKTALLRAAGVPILVLWYHEIEDLEPPALRTRIIEAQDEALKIPRAARRNVQPLRFPTRGDRFEALQRPRGKKRWPRRRLESCPLRHPPNRSD